MALLKIKSGMKAHALQALYNQAQPLGLGLLRYDPNPMSLAEAQEIMGDSGVYIDYLKGRPLKIDFRKDVIDTVLHDRDQPSAEQCLRDLDLLE